MRKEILPGKLSANRTVSTESPIVVEKKERGGGGGRLLLFLVAVGLGAVALTSITVLAPVAFYDYVNSPGSIDDRGDGAAIPTALAASVTATDGNGAVIEDNGSTKSGEMTMTGYSGKSYSTELSCSIDSLPTYCSGSPVTISGLPPGGHVFTIAEPLSDETTVESFSWDISG
jgi:hypothetical protein